MVGTTWIKAQKNEKTKGSREEATQVCWSLVCQWRGKKKRLERAAGPDNEGPRMIHTGPRTKSCILFRQNQWLGSVLIYLQSRQATALDHRLQTTPQWRKNPLSLTFTSGRKDETTLHKCFRSQQKHLWDKSRREDALLSIMEGSGNTMFTALPTHLKCSLYVYSACPERPAAHVVLFQFQFQNSYTTVLFSWNVQEKT